MILPLPAWINRNRYAGSTDEELLQASLKLLRENSQLEYSGEFGAEITTFVPFAAWLKQEGHLTGRRIKTYAGMRPYYFFLADDEFLTKNEDRCWVKWEERYWPSNASDTAVKSPWHVYPNYRDQYIDSTINFEKPVIFIQNKYAKEWEMAPINYFPLSGLELFLKKVSRRFDVVYSCPNNVPKSSGYSKDHNEEVRYADMEVLAKFPQVISFEKMCLERKLDYNRGVDSASALFAGHP